MNYLIVIPARGGSKSIPKKNIYPINGKPLIQYTLDLIEKILFLGDAVVSTDSQEIADVVTKYDNICVVRRPDEISGDTASTEQALVHALNAMEKRNHSRYDAVITLQATSPFRTAETINMCLRSFEENIDRYDALLTLTETRTDYWIQKESGAYQRLYPDAPRRRQDRKPMFIENSAVYITSVNALVKTNSVLGTNVNGIVIPEREALDINEPVDIIIAAQLLKGEHV